MNDLKGNVSEYLGKVMRVGSSWFSQIWNTTDYTISRITLYLKDKKRQLDDYLIDREKLLAQIRRARIEADRLYEDIERTNAQHTEKLLILYEKLEKRTETLIETKHDLSNLEQTIVETEEKIGSLSTEREQAINERNWLKSEYDHLQKIINEHFTKQEALRFELQALKEQQANKKFHTDAAIMQEIEKKEAEISRLQEMEHFHSLKFEELKRDLMKKVSHVAKLNTTLQELQEILREKEEKVIHLVQDLEVKTAEMIQMQDESKIAKQELMNMQAMLAEKKKSHELSQNRVEALTQALQEQEATYYKDMANADEQIEKMQSELIHQQNELAIAHAENANPVEMRPEELKILKHEYEPRFQTLYRDCHLQQAFFSDFFDLTPSDRLKVEACIVNLNFNYEMNMTKVRPNTVKTNGGLALNEYPFGEGNTGRIYFRKEQGKVHFFRISRTKNGRGKLDQKKVIAWLKKNY